MEREIALSSFPVRDVKGNRPGDFTTRFSPEIDLSDKNASYYIAFNKIISMALSWTNINSGYNNQKIFFSKDAGKTFTDIDSLRESGIIKILIIILRKRPKPLMVMEKKSIQLI